MKNRYSFLGKRYETSQTTVALVLVIPIVLCLVFLYIMPVIQLVILSFSNFSMITGQKKFIGVKNYIYLFEDPVFFKSLINTFLFSFIKLTLDVILALSLAVALNTRMPMRRFLRISYFMPVVVPVVASALIWIWFYDPGIGPLNQIFGWFGLPPQKWLSGENTAMLSVIIFSLWKGLGYNIVIFLAALQNIPESYLEAADIDGASGMQKFMRIKLPLISPTVAFVIMIGIINTFKMFTEINVMTPDGGPQKSTLLLVVYVYQQAFTNGKMGRGAAAAIVLFLIIFALTLIQKAFSKKTVFYE